jgi:hypothetical protein
VQVGAGGGIEHVGQRVLLAAEQRELVEPEPQRPHRRPCSRQRRRRDEQPLEIVGVDLQQQRLTGREVPVEGALPDPRGLGDRLHARLARIPESRPGHV